MCLPQLLDMSILVLENNDPTKCVCIYVYNADSATAIIHIREKSVAVEVNGVTTTFDDMTLAAQHLTKLEMETTPETKIIVQVRI